MKPYAAALCALCALIAHAASLAQTPPSLPAATPASSQADATPTNSALDAELFYQLLLGELNAVGGEPGAGFSLILDAARKTNDSSLYARAVNVALRNRSADAALQAARAWRQAQPRSRDANRYILQILIALNRIAETAEPLRTELALTEARDRATAIGLIPRNYARASDKKLAASVVEQALADSVADPSTAVAAWISIARVRLAASDTAGTLDAARRAQQADPKAEGPAIIGIELMEPKLPEAEALVRAYFAAAQPPSVDLRMGYARALLDAQRYPETARQLQAITQAQPRFAEAWLILGGLQIQESQLDAAEGSLRKYLELSRELPEETRARGQAQAFLGLAQIAEKRRDFTAAEAWLNRIENSQDLVSAQTRRASILARQGRLDDARKLLQGLPERNANDARIKLTAEVQLLRDSKQYQTAYDLLGGALQRAPDDHDLLYDQAMIAEKLDRLDDMEKLLRRVMTVKPDYFHAYNALGYSLADRNQRLPEARQLIQKALDLAPGDPYITDSLGWVEFRMGNRAEALRLLESAYRNRPDAEIAAHLGEVLWAAGQRDRAVAIWKEGLLLNSENETLQQTLKRLRVRP